MLTLPARVLKHQRSWKKAKERNTCASPFLLTISTYNYSSMTANENWTSLTNCTISLNKKKKLYTLQLDNKQPSLNVIASILHILFPTLWQPLHFILHDIPASWQINATYVCLTISYTYIANNKSILYTQMEEQQAKILLCHTVDVLFFSLVLSLKLLTPQVSWKPLSTVKKR